MINDTLPEVLEIRAVAASIGTPTIDGQTVRLKLAQIAAPQTVTITVTARMRENMRAGLVVNNACLTADGGVAQCASAQVLQVSELPQTGQSPWSVWRRALLGLLAVLFVNTAWMVGKRLMR